MGDVLAIARDTTLTIYESQDGMFKDIALIELASEPSDETIVLIVTALAQIQHRQNGSTPPKRAPRTARKSTVKKTEDEPRKKGFIDEELELKTIGGFSEFEWRTIKHAHDIMDKYANLKSFGSNVRRAFDLGMLERREESLDETRKRLGIGSGRPAFLYKLTPTGVARLKELGDASSRKQEDANA